MDKQSILERIEKVEEAIARKEARIEKLKNNLKVIKDYWATHDKAEEKQKVDNLLDDWYKACNVDANSFESVIGADKKCKEYKAYSKAWDLLDKMSHECWIEDDIKRRSWELEKKQKTLEKYVQMLEKEDEKENVYCELPEVLKKVEAEYFEEYKKFFANDEKYSKMRTAEEIEKHAKQEARDLVLVLWYKVRAITGEVTEVHNLVYRSYKGLDGFVVGKNGIAEVETIVAGGYNIQCRHLRMLVHRRK